MYLIMVDAYSKWPEVFQLQSTTTTKTIEVLERINMGYLSNWLVIMDLNLDQLNLPTI